jgi:alanyl-tRNA synthetase
MTERLYYYDSYRTTFDARVVENFILNGAPAVVLDSTIFYPTSGGQPHDTGILNGIPVQDVVEREEDQSVVHVLLQAEKESPLQAGDLVQGMIDWGRRFDHMQQHTGQHVLSQAFVQTIDADTVGFHLSSEYSTIDLNHDTLSDREITRAEELANQIVFDDRPVIARFVEPAEASLLPLRKAAPAKASIRIVQVEGFDWSACGGTHVARTGEIGIIKIVRSERRGPETRITFLCGHRALSHYHKLNTLARDLALNLSVGIEELSPAIERLQGEARSARKERDQLRQAMLDYEAQALAGNSQKMGSIQVVSKVLEERDVQEVRRLAARITERPGRVALLGMKGTKAQLVFSRSADLPYDMRPLLRDACRLVGGGGGGSPDLAQGGGPQANRIEDALRLAGELLGKQVEPGEDA